ncbi:MAG: 16S rRNA (cytosine(1402)-N(4))-methyltransferase RsmH [Flavobacteriales bacterium]|nr:16S rRNA (cytosine(1402)-N(4))-methyltransferase RsmH [Flavobacteriales bacterium]
MSTIKKEEGYHKPVLLMPSVDALDIKPDGVYVDVTFGGGGHSREILKRLNQGKLIAFDQDPDAKKNVIADPRFHFVDQNFRFMKNWLRLLKCDKVDGILADLGVSSHQFDSEDRGFSIRFDAKLDMRMDQQRTLTAAKVVNEYSEDDLRNILRSYGEIDGAGRMARDIIQSRPIRSSEELKQAIEKHLPRMKEHKVLAQVFQALRIEVNEELEVLKDFLKQCSDVLQPGGRLVVISYHSLEDRLVKDFMKTGNFEGKPDKDFFGNLHRPLKPLHSKPLLPDDDEISANTRARSAKMRVAEKLNETSR